MDEYIEREASMYIAFKYPFFSDSLMEEIKAIPAKENTRRNCTCRYNISI